MGRGGGMSSFAHTAVSASHPVRSAKLSTAGPTQYSGGGPLGNRTCCKLSFLFLMLSLSLPPLCLIASLPSPSCVCLVAKLVPPPHSFCWCRLTLIHAMRGYKCRPSNTFMVFSYKNDFHRVTFSTGYILKFDMVGSSKHAKL